MSSTPPRDPGSSRVPGVPISSSDAAFAGFRLFRREPLTFAIWCGVSLALSLGMIVAMIVLAGPAFMQLQAANTMTATGVRPDPAIVFAPMAALIPAYGIMLVLWLVAAAVLNAAAIRGVLRPGPDGAGHLRFGADELRQLAVMFLLWLLMFVIYLVAWFAVVAVGMVVALAMGAGSGATPNPAAFLIIGLVAMVLFLGVVLALAFIGVRLSLASALTFDTGRVRLFGSWSLTRGRFWPLFGAYLLAGVIMMVLYLVVIVGFAAIGAATSGFGATGSVMRPNMSSLSAYFTPLQVAYLLVTAPLTALWMVVQAATPADAYRQITRGGSPLAVFGPSDAERSTAFGARP